MSKLKKLRFWKSIGLIVLGVGLLIIGSIYLALAYWEPIAKKAIKESFYQSTNKLYRIDFDNIGFNVFLGNFSLNNIKLIPDLEVYKQLKRKKEQPAYLFNLHIERAKLHGIDLYNLYQYKELNIDEIAVNNPNVVVLNDLSYKKSISDTSIFRNPYDLIKAQLHFLKVEQINLKNIKLEFVADSLGKTKRKKIFLSYFKVRNLFIDSLSQHDTTRPFYSDDIKISIKNFNHQFKDSVNTMQFEEAVASTATSSIQVYNFKVIPKYTDEAFKDTQGFLKTRIDLYIKEANLTQVNFKKLFFEQKLYGANIEINKLESRFLLNKLIDRNKNKKVRFPTELVYDIRIPFHFDVVKLYRSKIVYAEIDRKTKVKWDINFSELNATIKNLSNDSTYLTKNQFATIEIASKFNKSGNAKFEFILDYINPLKPFYFKGNINNFNLQEVNPIISKIAHLEVSNCNLRSVHFIMNGDKKEMNCNVSMLYNNLRVKILEYNKEEKKLQKHGLLTLLANYMVIEKENPRNNGRFVRPKFVIKRDNDRSFFGFIWVGLLQGIKESVGLDLKMENELKTQANRYTEFKNFTKELKENRKQRKKERLKLRLLKQQERNKENSLMTMPESTLKTI